LKTSLAAQNTAQIRKQVKSVRQQLESEREKFTSLVDEFPSVNEAYSAYSSFLSLLDSGHVILMNQQATITQSTTNPFITTTVAEEKNNFKQSVLDKVSPSPAPSGAAPAKAPSAVKEAGGANKTAPAAGGSSAAKGVSNAQAAGKAAPKELVVTGEIKQGLNYYHLEMVLQGAYVNYLFARQSLINAIPNSIIQRELIHSQATMSEPLEIKLYISIPFLSDKGD
jgi:hypothetical protein